MLISTNYLATIEIRKDAGVCTSNSRQNRHPERSASQIYRMTQRLWRGVEGPRRCLSYPCCSELFNHRSPQSLRRAGVEDGTHEKISRAYRSESCSLPSMVEKLRAAWVR